MKLFALPVRVITAALAFVSVAACSEKLESSGVCAVLCPPVGGDVQNITLFDAVVFDTTVQAFSGLGAEGSLLLATRGDTLDARVIMRFDSIPPSYIQGTDTTAITMVDSAYIRLRLDTLSIKGTDAVSIEAYDVDTTANDTSTAAVLALFRPDRFISAQTFTRAQLADSISYFISNAAVLSKAQSQLPLRIGLRAVSASSSQLRFLSSESGIPPLLRFRVSSDTAIRPILLATRSRTPVDDPIVADNLADYTVFAKQPPPGPPTDLDVGGFPPRRAYIRFDIPANLIDSSTVVRATLLLNQIPNPLLDPTDTVFVVPQLVTAGISVTDPTKASQIVADIALDTLKVRAGDAGLKQVELARAFVIWRSLKAAETPRAIILRSAGEGSTALEIRFSSLEAAAALRPRLRISYTNQVPLGLP